MARKPAKGMVVEIVYRVDGTTYNDRYTSRHASVTLLKGGRGTVVFRDGHDADGPVATVQYADVAKVVRRPFGKRRRR